MVYEEIYSSVEAVIKIKGNTTIRIKLCRMGEHEDMVSFDIDKPSLDSKTGKNYSVDLSYGESSALYDILGEVLGK
jgi:hypothetical protein